MTPEAGSLSLAAALVAGIAASGHCAGMCGGIAGAVAMRRPQAGIGGRIGQAVACHVSRITSYAVAGAIAGFLGSALLEAVDVAPLSIALRVLAGLIMLAAAARLLFGWRLLDPLESAGAGLWRRVAPWAGRQSRSGGIGGAIGLGLAWGWLPCGMTYSMLLLAATTTSLAMGAAVMFAFGLGTLPSMITATIAFERVARSLSTRVALRNVAGILLLGFGAWTGGSALWHGTRHAAHAAPGHGHGPPPAVEDHSHHADGISADDARPRADHSLHGHPQGGDLD